MEPFVLSTERLELSAPVGDDVEAIYAACQDDDIQRYTLVPSPYGRSDAVAFVDRVARGWGAGTELTWAIRERGALVGMIGLHDIAHANASLGYWLAPEGRGRGLIAEAATAVIDRAFTTDGPGLLRIEWRAVVGNTGSARIAQRLGFRYEGTLRQEFVNARGRRDGWVASLLRDDERVPQRWTLPD